MVTFVFICNIYTGLLVESHVFDTWTLTLILILHAFFALFCPKNLMGYMSVYIYSRIDWVDYLEMFTDLYKVSNPPTQVILQFSISLGLIASHCVVHIKSNTIRLQLHGSWKQIHDDNFQKSFQWSGPEAAAVIPQYGLSLLTINLTWLCRYRGNLDGYHFFFLSFMMWQRHSSKTDQKENCLFI